jgi:hypothetical protein
MNRPAKEAILAKLYLQGLVLSTVAFKSKAEFTLPGFLAEEFALIDKM